MVWVGEVEPLAEQPCCHVCHCHCDNILARLLLLALWAACLLQPLTTQPRTFSNRPRGCGGVSGVKLGWGLESPISPTTWVKALPTGHGQLMSYHRCWQNTRVALSWRTFLFVVSNVLLSNKNWLTVFPRDNLFTLAHNNKRTDMFIHIHAPSLPSLSLLLSLLFSSLLPSVPYSFFLNLTYL